MGHDGQLPEGNARQLYDFIMDDLDKESRKEAVQNNQYPIRIYEFRENAYHLVTEEAPPHSQLSPLHLRQVGEARYDVLYIRN